MSDNYKRSSKKLPNLFFFPLLIILLGARTFYKFLKLLPPSNLAAFINAVFAKAPSYLFKWAEEKTEDRNYSTIPELMLMADGNAIKTAPQFEKRKDEIIQLYKNIVYGEIPEIPYLTAFKVIEESTTALNSGSIRKQIEITIETEYGKSHARMLLYLPKSDKPVPTFIGLNFQGNHTIWDDPAILPSMTIPRGKANKARGSEDRKWPLPEIIARGYGVATIHCDDFAPDNNKLYLNQWGSVFAKPNGDSQEIRAINLWAYGLMKGIDYLVTDNAVDKNRLISIGHSRLGKVSLWAGAQDKRIAMVISNNSGNSGAALSRSHRGETVGSIQTIFPHWFADTYKQYMQNENSLPLDQHMLLASIAPRKLYVASASDDLWADPEGEFNALRLASKGFEIYGLLAFDPDRMPETGKPIFTENIAYHLRKGEHDITAEDWHFYIDFAEQYLK